MGFIITHKDKLSKARAGLLATKTGAIETPLFMPVATKTAVKHISSEDLESMGAKAIICNAYILSLKPGTKIIKNLGGIGKFMNFSGVVFTDSGGFQMYSPSLFLGSNENEVIFRNPFSGEKVFMTPEKNMEIQFSLKSDVAMCLDNMPLYGESKEKIAEAIRKTANWARMCKNHHDKLQKNIPAQKRQLLFGITQGGIYEGLREESAREIAEIDFDGYALGGLALGEPKEDEYRMIEIVKNIIPNEKPVYLMGAGEPLELLEAISRGVDIFDSRFPTKNARHGTLFTWNGKLAITNAKYKDDKKSIDEKCSCFVCRNYSKAYIHNLLWHNEGTGLRLASYHNLYFLQELIRKARETIMEGKFEEQCEEIKKFYN